MRGTTTHRLRGRLSPPLSEVAARLKPVRRGGNQTFSKVALMCKPVAVVLLAAFSMLASPPSQVIAAALNLSTGLDASDALLNVGNSLDAHWTVDQPLGGIA